MEALRREVATLKEEKEKAKKARGILDKKREDKVHNDLLALDAAKAKHLSDSNLYTSKLLSQFGPEDNTKKDVGTRQKISQQGASKTGSPAKRRRADNPHPAPADPHHSRTLPPPKGAGQSKMLLKQGFHLGGQKFHLHRSETETIPTPSKGLFG